MTILLCVKIVKFVFQTWNFSRFMIKWTCLVILYISVRRGKPIKRYIPWRNFYAFKLLFYYNMIYTLRYKHNKTYTGVHKNLWYSILLDGRPVTYRRWPSVMCILIRTIGDRHGGEDCWLLPLSLIHVVDFLLSSSICRINRRGDVELDGVNGVVIGLRRHIRATRVTEIQTINYKEEVLCIKYNNIKQTKPVEMLKNKNHKIIIILDIDNSIQQDLFKTNMYDLTLQCTNWAKGQAYFKI